MLTLAGSFAAAVRAPQKCAVSTFPHVVLLVNLHADAVVVAMSPLLYRSFAVPLIYISAAHAAAAVLLLLLMHQQNSAIAAMLCCFGCCMVLPSAYDMLLPMPRAATACMLLLLMMMILHPSQNICYNI